MPDKKHNFTMTEIRAGFFVLVSVAVVLGFIALIQGLRPEKEVVRYYAKFTNTLGLREGAEVRYGGNLSGKVGPIAVDPDDHTQILVAVEVDPGTPVNEESVATIEVLSLTAERHLEISTGAADAALQPEGATLKSVTSSGGFIDIPDMDGLVSGGEDIIGDLRKLLGVQEAVAEEEAGGEEFANVTRITSDVRKLMGVEEAEAAEEAGEREMPTATAIVGDVRDLLGVEEAKAAEAAGTGEMVALTDITADVEGLFDKYEPELEKIIEDVGPVMDSVKELVDELNAVVTDNRPSIDNAMTQVDELLTKLNSEMDELTTSVKATLQNAEGLTSDLGDVLNQNRPTVEDLLDDLASTMRNLNIFVETLRNQPQAVIWGKPDHGRKSK